MRPVLSCSCSSVAGVSRPVGQTGTSRGSWDTQLSPSDESCGSPNTGQKITSGARLTKAWRVSGSGHLTQVRKVTSSCSSPYEKAWRVSSSGHLTQVRKVTSSCSSPYKSLACERQWSSNTCQTVSICGQLARTGRSAALGKLEYEVI